MIAPAQLAFLETQLQKIRRRPSAYVGLCYRCVVPLYGNSRDALSGAGRLKSSGRFHSGGAFRIVYTACSARTAEWEFFHTARSRGFPKEDLYPMTTLVITADLEGVLKLTNPLVLRALGVSRQDLQAPVWQSSSQETLTQAIGRLAYETGFTAILVPSAGRGQNLNVMPDRMTARDVFEIRNVDRLPPPL
ncbi:MAG: RES family NAD+ phosphorylase [Armatimonadota bacterium]|nr:RES family NAD+ phosphorylase [Armatimonadota bacterium]